MLWSTVLLLDRFLCLFISPINSLIMKSGKTDREICNEKTPVNNTGLPPDKSDRVQHTEPSKTSVFPGINLVVPPKQMNTYFWFDANHGFFFSFKKLIKNARSNKYSRRAAVKRASPTCLEFYYSLSTGIYLREAENRQRA